MLAVPWSVRMVSSVWFIASRSLVRVVSLAELVNGLAVPSPSFPRRLKEADVFQLRDLPVDGRDGICVLQTGL